MGRPQSNLWVRHNFRLSRMIDLVTRNDRDLAIRGVSPGIASRTAIWAI